MLKLIGMLDSPYVRRVAITLRLYGIPFEHVALSVFRTQEQMRLINPTLKVPAFILEDGTRLLDSSLILDYVDSLVPAERRLLPQGTIRWKVQAAVGLGLVVCEKAVQLFYEYTLRPDTLRFDGWSERCRAQLHAALQELEGTDVLAGHDTDQLNQAEITVAVALGFMRHIQDRLPSGLLETGAYPRLQALSDFCESLPAFRQTPLV